MDRASNARSKFSISPSESRAAARRRRGAHVRLRALRRGPGKPSDVEVGPVTAVSVAVAHAATAASELERERVGFVDARPPRQRFLRADRIARTRMEHADAHQDGRGRRARCVAAASFRELGGSETRLAQPLEPRQRVSGEATAIVMQRRACGTRARRRSRSRRRERRASRRASARRARSSAGSPSARASSFFFFFFFDARQSCASSATMPFRRVGVASRTRAARR